ncbi:hypothetical protein JW859_13325 [bacterium]|nr:hypothetical protein [bacterium]
MRYRFGAILLVLLLAAGCGGQTLDPSRTDGFELEPIDDSSTDGISLTLLDPYSYRLTFSAIPAEGQFIRLAIPVARVVGREEWEGDDHIIHIVGNAPAGPEIGIRPVDGYTGNPVSVVLRTVAGERTVNGPPNVFRSAVLDLAVIDLGGGRVRLEWTENNNGDYNFDSLVSVNDLTPIGQNFGIAYEGSFDDTLYWVDGNHDGEVNVVDITPIGQNFGGRIFGYNVYRNGVVEPSPIGALATIRREDAIFRDKLPPKYVVELDADLLDEWSVAPVDPTGRSGIESLKTALPDTPDLRVQLAIDGLTLFDLDGSGEFGPLEDSGRCYMKVVDPFEILRRIAPGDIPNLAAIGTSAGENTPTANFYELPHDQALALLVMYAPTFELDSGAPKGDKYSSAAPPIAIEHETTVIPFRLRDDTDITDLAIAIELSENPDGGYFTTVTTTQQDIGDPVETTVRLNHLDSVVSMDNDGDDDAGQEYADEAQLADAEWLATSDRRLERLVDRDNYGQPNSRQVYGRIAEWNEASGVLDLTAVHTRDLYNNWIHLDELSVLVSEDSNFVGEDDSDLVPSSLLPSDFVLINADLLWNAALDPAEKYWAREVRLITSGLPPSAILAANPTSAELPPLTVEFDASASFDLDGTIVKYEFDFGEGAGWEDYGTTPTATHVYDHAPVWNTTAQLRVTDDGTPPATDSAAVTINIGPEDTHTLSVAVTINTGGFATTDMPTEVRLYDFAATDIGDVPLDTHTTGAPLDGVPQVLNFIELTAGEYWVMVIREVTAWDGGDNDLAVFGPITVPLGDEYAITGTQYDEPPPP